MRISDWSSDVCSSDLIAEPRQIEQHRVRSSRRQRLEVGCSFAERAGDGVTARESRFRKRAAQPTRNARNQPSTAHSGHPSKTSPARSEEHTSELQSLMRISYAVFCLKKKKTNTTHSTTLINT